MSPQADLVNVPTADEGPARDRATLLLLRQTQARLRQAEAALQESQREVTT